MINDIHILAGLIKSRELYTTLSTFISEQDISTQAQPIFREIVSYYEADAAAPFVDVTILISKLSRKYTKQAEFYNNTLNNLPEITSDSNFFDEVLSYKRAVLGHDLAGLLLNPNSDQESVRDAITAYTSVGATAEAKDSAIVAKSLDDLIKVFSPEGLFPLYPKSLNNRVGGGVPLHTHIGLMGYPESGKTLFATNLAAQAAKHGHRVLYIANEDPVDMYIMRIINRLTDMTRQEIMENPLVTRRLLDSSGYSNIILDDTAPCRFNRIEKLINKYEPRYVIYDQLRQIDMPGIDGEVAQLTAATKEARRLCKQYPIITLSVTQAGDSAKNKLVLDMGDVYNSNTTFPGDVDILLGWGTNDAYDAQSRRVITLCKNKITGKHEHFSVLVDATKSKIWSEE